MVYEHMINTTSIARPYAKAAFEAATQSNELPMWLAALKQLSLIVQDTSVKSIIKNPNYTKTQLADFLISCLHKIAGNGSENGFLSIDNFIRLLSEKKRLSLVPAIAILFEQDNASKLGYLFLDVTSAFEMNADQKENTKEKLQKQFNSKCEIEYQVDPSVIGGLLIRSKDWVLDSTIKGSLEKLKNILV